MDAFIALKQCAERGEQSAFMMLGYMYDVGEGTCRDTAKAIYWYKQAYSCGDSAAAANIATVYRDQGKARLEFGWYKRAADLGDGDSMVEVGIRYLSGKGVRRNAARAVQCFTEALSSTQICEESLDAARQLLWGCTRVTVPANNACQDD